MVAPVYNEEANLAIFVDRVEKVFAKRPDLRFEIIFVDNASTDNSPRILRELCAQKPYCRAVFNAVNCGHLKNQFYALLLGRGDATVLMASDLQDPPEVIPELLAKWEAGAPLVLLQKTKSEESRWMYALRGAYYRIMRGLSDHAHYEQVNGAGLYARATVEALRACREVDPYLRGLVAELGVPPAFVEFTQPLRRGGRSKNNFWTLFDAALLGMTSQTRWPARLPLLTGALLGGGAVLLLWQDPLLAYVTALAAVILFCVGLVGEYVMAVGAQLKVRPLAVERERVNFPEQWP